MDSFFLYKQLVQMKEVTQVSKDYSRKKEKVSIPSLRFYLILCIVTGEQTSLKSSRVN